MKFTKFNPAKLFKSKKSRSVARSQSETPSFSSQSSAEAFKTPTGGDGFATPISVLPDEDWSSAFSGEIYSDMKHAFQMIDSDGDGKIQKSELENLLSRLGAEPPSPEELKLMLSEVDRDGDGCISLEEFYAIGSAFSTAPACDAELKEAFDFFDCDRDGRITAEELFSVFETIGGEDARCTLEECRRMIGGVDKNGDGFVCFEDFCRMMDQQQQRRS